jgi:hypothetical protein
VTRPSDPQPIGFESDDQVLFVVDEEEFEAAVRDPRVQAFHDEADAEFRRLEEAGRVIC